MRLQGERGRRFALAVEDVGQDRSGAFTFGAPRRSRFSASRWVALSPRAFAGAPDREQPVEFRVRVPRDAEPGDHVTSITVKRLASPGSGSAALVQAVAVRLTIRVAGTLRPAVELRELSVPSIAGGGPVGAAVTVRNTGNVRLDFDHANRGALAVQGHEQDPDGRLAFFGVLYPGEARTFRLVWEDPPVIGRFGVRAAVRLPGGETAIRRTVWIIPWRQALALALVALAAALVLGGRRARRKRERP